MSHVVNKEPLQADAQIRNIAALKWAAEHYCGGLVFKEGQHHFRTWKSDHGGRLVGDWPVPEGYTAEEVGKHCDHAIGLKDARSGTGSYEIGVVPSRKFPGTYSLMYDFFGGALEQQAGKGLEKLMQGYQVRMSQMVAQQTGDPVKQYQDGEDTIIEIDTTVRMGV